MPRTDRPPRLQAELDRMEAERARYEREATSVTRRGVVRVCLECIGSCALGLVVMAFGFHTTDLALGKVFYYGGLVVGYGGITIALYNFHQRGKDRGDW
jgi:hypothetical protein